jgi:hypothetical protein
MMTSVALVTYANFSDRQNHQAHAVLATTILKSAIATRLVLWVVALSAHCQQAH